jgi:hypothetical protein
MENPFPIGSPSGTPRTLSRATSSYASSDYAFGGPLYSPPSVYSATERDEEHQGISRENSGSSLASESMYPYDDMWARLRDEGDYSFSSIPNSSEPERTRDFSMLQDGRSIPRDPYSETNGDASSITPTRSSPPLEGLDPELSWSFVPSVNHSSYSSKFRLNDWLMPDNENIITTRDGNPSKNYLNEEFWEDLKNVDNLTFPDFNKELASEVETKILSHTKIVPTTKGNVPSVYFVKDMLARIRFLRELELTQKEFEKFQLILHSLLSFTTNDILTQINEIMDTHGGKLKRKRTKRIKRKRTKRLKNKYTKRY